MEITPRIYTVGGGSLTSPQDAAIYLIRTDEQAALVDAGTGDGLGRLIENIRDCGVQPEQIEYLLVTHCHFDHTGGLKALRDLTGATVVAHDLEAPFIEEGNDTVTAAKWYGTTMTPCPVDLRISGDRQDVMLGDRTIQAIHVPGHSPGSIVYMMESSGKRVLFGQDVHGPLDPGLLSDRADYQESLQLMLSLNADILCEGHFGVYHGKEEVAAFIRSFME
ncbi:MAG: MBL fold metallo-hydrolase [Deltaproteobacteria bacterium]|nr:MBL fold metallo-hydrolase [Deltaproteobacteria bacterium]